MFDDGIRWGIYLGISAHTVLRIRSFSDMSMNNIGFIYPGQGSQKVGMGKDFYESFIEARSVYDNAEDILGFPLKDISFSGPEDSLKQTYVTQLALFVHSVVVTECLKERGLTPVITAGHSLGEYSALYGAGVAGFDALLSIVKVRGELMQSAGEKAPGTMAALIGSDEKTVDDLCQKAASAGIVCPANFNAPGQIVISGSVKGVHKAIDLAKEYGIRKAVELNVSAAFHSPLMADAISGLTTKIQATEFHLTDIPVVSNVTAQPMFAPDEMKGNLEKQLVNPVRWSESINYIVENGIDSLIEVGAGAVLQGLVKRIDKEIPCISVGTVEGLERIMESVS